MATGKRHASKRATSPAAKCQPFDAWKVYHLLRWDTAISVLDVTRVASPWFYILQARWQVPAAFIAFAAAFTAIVAFPTVVMMVQRPMYMRWRDALWSSSCVVSNVLCWAMGLAYRGMPMWHSLAELTLRRPLLYAMAVAVWQPAVQRLSPAAQAVACIGQALALAAPAV